MFNNFDCREGRSQFLAPCRSNRTGLKDKRSVLQKRDKGRQKEIERKKEIERTKGRERRGERKRKRRQIGQLRRRKVTNLSAVSFHT